MGTLAAVVAHRPHIALIEINLALLGGKALAQMLGENRHTQNCAVVFYSAGAPADLDSIARTVGALARFRSRPTMPRSVACSSR